MLSGATRPGGVPEWFTPKQNKAAAGMGASAQVSTLRNTPLGAAVLLDARIPVARPAQYKEGVTYSEGPAHARCGHAEVRPDLFSQPRAYGSDGKHVRAFGGPPLLRNQTRLPAQRPSS